MIDQEDRFEVSMEEVLGDWIRGREEYASATWGSLANVIWVHGEGGETSYSFRCAGSLIAEIRGGGHYMDWYCTAPFGVLHPHVEDMMSKEGWSWKLYD